LLAVPALGGTEELKYAVLAVSKGLIAFPPLFALTTRISAAGEFDREGGWTTFSGIAAGGLNPNPALNCCDQRLEEEDVGGARLPE
jgi:hypothetical protein